MKLTAEIAREFLDYSPETGELTWKLRARYWFKTSRSFNSWNAKFAYKTAFYIGDQGYRKGSILGKTYKAHRVIWLWMTGEWPDHTDHINGVRNDNRWSNLRNVNAAGNSKNSKLRSDNTSGRVGIYQRKDSGAWVAEMWISGEKRKWQCESKEKAILRRKAAEVLYGFHENHGRTGRRFAGIIQA